MAATTNFTTVTLHLHRQIALLKQQANLLGTLVEEQFENALRAMTENDIELAEKVVQLDKEVDQREITLEEECLKIIALYQPVAVQDVAQATCETLEDPDCGGKIYELGGPDIFSFKNLMEIMLRHTGQKRILAPLPFFAANLISRFTQFLPNPPLTPDQVIMLRSDNIADENLPGLGDLGIAPTPIESVLPHYLSRFKGR